MFLQNMFNNKNSKTPFPRPSVLFGVGGNNRKHDVGGLGGGGLRKSGPHRNRPGYKNGGGKRIFASSSSSSFTVVDPEGGGGGSFENRRLDTTPMYSLNGLTGEEARKGSG